MARSALANKFIPLLGFVLILATGAVPAVGSLSWREQHHYIALRGVLANTTLLVWGSTPLPGR